MTEFGQTGYFTDKNGVNSKTLPQKKVKGVLEYTEIERPTTQVGGSYQKKGYPVNVNSKNPNIPKKVCHPYLFFVKLKSADAMKQMPEDGKKGASGITKHLSGLWAKMSEQEKQPYVDMQTQDRVRRDRQLKEVETLRLRAGSLWRTELKAMSSGNHEVHTKRDQNPRWSESDTIITNASEYNQEE